MKSLSRRPAANQGLTLDWAEVWAERSWCQQQSRTATLAATCGSGCCATLNIFVLLNPYRVHTVSASLRLTAHNVEWRVDEELAHRAQNQKPECGG